MAMQAWLYENPASHHGHMEAVALSFFMLIILGGFLTPSVLSVSEAGIISLNMPQKVDLCHMSVSTPEFARKRRYVPCPCHGTDLHLAGGGRNGKTVLLQTQCRRVVGPAIIWYHKVQFQVHIPLGGGMFPCA